MKILFINKRRYTGKDVVDDQFGRMWEFPEHLAQFGHDVTVRTIKYQPWGQLGSTEYYSSAGVRWSNSYLWPFPPRSIVAYYKSLSESIRADRPDVLVASSDAIHAILGAHCARKHNVPLVIDLYDQFEAFGASRLPGLVPAFRRSLLAASVVICVSERLRGWCTTKGIEANKTYTLGNAVSKELFYPMDLASSRQRLKLPASGQFLLGTAGSLSGNRDIKTLYHAFMKIADERDDVHLVLAGPRQAAPPTHPRIHDLGILKHSDIPCLFSALDLGIVCNANNSFSYYCCPQKLLEMQACGIPALIADIIDPSILARPGVLTYKTGDSQNMFERILQHITSPSPGTTRIPAAPTWEEQARKLEAVLSEVINTK